MSNDHADAIAPLARFMEYFRYNYPGPNTIIAKPDWHAPKIYAAALDASGHRELLEACREVALSNNRVCRDHFGHGSMCDCVGVQVRAAIAKAEQGR